MDVPGDAITEDASSSASKFVVWISHICQFWCKKFRHIGSLTGETIPGTRKMKSQLDLYYYTLMLFLVQKLPQKILDWFYKVHLGGRQNNQASGFCAFCKPHFVIELMWKVMCIVVVAAVIIIIIIGKLHAHPIALLSQSFKLEHFGNHIHSTKENSKHGHFETRSTPWQAPEFTMLSYVRWASCLVQPHLELWYNFLDVPNRVVWEERESWKENNNDRGAKKKWERERSQASPLSQTILVLEKDLGIVNGGDV